MLFFSTDLQTLSTHQITSRAGKHIIILAINGKSSNALINAFIKPPSYILRQHKKNINRIIKKIIIFYENIYLYILFDKKLLL